MTRRFFKKVVIPAQEKAKSPLFTPEICHCLNKLAYARVQPATECGYFATYGSWLIAVS